MDRISLPLGRPNGKLSSRILVNLLLLKLGRTFFAGKSFSDEAHERIHMESFFKLSTTSFLYYRLIFRENSFIATHNARFMSGKVGYEMGINEFTDMVSSSFSSSFFMEEPMEFVDRGRDGPTLRLPAIDNEQPSGAGAKDEVLHHRRSVGISQRK